jgi:hypothetical protein
LSLPLKTPFPSRYLNKTDQHFRARNGVADLILTKSFFHSPS